MPRATKVDSIDLELIENVTKDITETVKVIEFLIDQLPGLNEAEDSQVCPLIQLARLEALDKENKIQGQRLEEAIKQGQALQSTLQDTLGYITDRELKLVK